MLGNAHTWTASTPVPLEANFSSAQPDTVNAEVTAVPVPGLSSAIKGRADITVMFTVFGVSNLPVTMLWGHATSE